ncbi:Qat anti-phage system ATPase QatA [Accumulibacter sp.]|jgi:predicted KAP-like P-loop ATPase|uniref:KAP P-loop domain protein n=1 Tax=Accumulibacter regalis TaxID=522306 RepID=C7RPK2_ACCRE|nr:Qat anti-phage system ATPase QatA [Accumulibacter sp.]MBN8499145.1 NTPase KAP [Accumulibacter sp.]MBO3714237.1 NTPase KAP [Accumulibacter sp.]
MILPDNETKIDLLNNEAIATTIIGLLRERPDSPVTIGVHGDWGAGKSSVLEMIASRFENEEQVLCLKFNGWRFQGFEDAKIALIEGIVAGLMEKRPALQKVKGALNDVVKSIDLLKVAKKAGGLAWTAFTGIPTPEQIGGIVATLQGWIANPAELATKDNIGAAIEDVKSVLSPAESKSVPQEVEAFRKAFDKLLEEARIDQLVVLIDDLDRCLPDTAIETLEAIRLFVFTSRTAFVVAADEAMVEYAVRKHFPDLPETTGPRDYARNYLEKLIQIPFRIPALGETETRIYVTLLLAGAEIGEKDENFSKLIAVARERLKRPWENALLDAASVKAALGDRADQTHNALMLSDQIGPILASGTKGNPRQIKRFLNTLLLRERTAIARGFGAEIKLPVLAKLMLAERFIPRLFDQIASVAAIHPQGQCDDLAALEASIAAKQHVTKTAEEGKAAKPTDNAATAIESAALLEWKESEAVQDWARVQPLLSGVDLRPYLFVTKDKKDFFGPVSVLGHLGTVVEKLFGAKLSVQAYAPELKLLVQAEADKVFEAVRSRIMGSGSFDVMPAGIDGLIVLIKAQPGLQGKLLDFLEGLPSSKCGPWAVRGWQGAVTDPENVARLSKLLNEWAKVSNNRELRAAAEAVLKASKGSR